MQHVAFLGAGMIASGMVERARSRGVGLRVWNRTHDKAKALERFGATAVGTPADAVKDATRVHVVLNDDAAVDSVLDAAGDALGGIVIDHTTASPAGTKARAERLARRGIGFLHAPVFMSPAMCREGKGIMLASGKRETFAEVAAELGQMTGEVVYFGERADLAAANKLFGNAMILTITAGIADVFNMAKAAGISVEDAYALFSKFNPTGTLLYRGANMAKANFAPSFELSMARKDARLMLELAQSGNVELGVLPSIASWMDRLIARGHDKDDLGVLAIDAHARAPRST
jgi:3-hydroxyisobutyrate dehydrogenase-like beta-hydroxyacid dehydrogenase